MPAKNKIPPDPRLTGATAVVVVGGANDRLFPRLWLLLLFLRRFCAAHWKHKGKWKGAWGGKRVSFYGVSGL